MYTTKIKMKVTSRGGTSNLLQSTTIACRTVSQLEARGTVNFFLGRGKVNNTSYIYEHDKLSRIFLMFRLFNEKKLNSVTGTWFFLGRKFTFKMDRIMRTSPVYYGQSSVSYAHTSATWPEKNSIALRRGHQRKLFCTSSSEKSERIPCLGCVGKGLEAREDNNFCKAQQLSCKKGAIIPGEDVA